MNYYQVLQVDRAASQEVIEAAYRRLARMYHPDINKQPDAVSKMQQINEAYAVIGNPTKRSEYDRSLNSEQHATDRRSSPPPSSRGTGQQSSGPQHQHQASTSSAGIPVACAKCGAQNATLRIAAFPYVVSLVFVTFQRAWGGVYCEQCRTGEMMRAKLISFFLGWWGIPFGIFYTLANIFGPSGGRIPAHENAEFLKFLGASFLMARKLVQAEEAMRSSLAYEWDAELAALYEGLFGRISDTRHVEANSNASGAIFGVAALLFIAAIGLTTLSGGSCAPPPPATPTSPLTARASATAIPTPRATISANTAEVLPTPAISSPVSTHSPLCVAVPLTSAEILKRLEASKSGSAEKWGVPQTDATGVWIDYVCQEINLRLRIPNGYQPDIPPLVDNPEARSIMFVRNDSPQHPAIYVDSRPIATDAAISVASLVDLMLHLKNSNNLEFVVPTRILRTGTLPAASAVLRAYSEEDGVTVHFNLTIAATPGWLHYVDVVGTSEQAAELESISGGVMSGLGEMK